jgi:hypothetical protein
MNVINLAHGPTIALVVFVYLLFTNMGMNPIWRSYLGNLWFAPPWFWMPIFNFAGDLFGDMILIGLGTAISHSPHTIEFRCSINGSITIPFAWWR